MPCLALPVFLFHRFHIFVHILDLGRKKILIPSSVALFFCFKIVFSLPSKCNGFPLSPFYFFLPCPCIITPSLKQQNLMTVNDFFESDNALSQMLRSVAPSGVSGSGGPGAPPVVRVVRGAGADGRWTEVKKTRTRTRIRTPKKIRPFYSYLYEKSIFQLIFKRKVGGLR